MAQNKTLPTKHCGRCGRIFSWRSKWRHHWATVRFCSNRCRRNPVSSTDRAIEAMIKAMVKGRRRVSIDTMTTACGDLLGSTSTEEVKSAARRLANGGHLKWRQNGQPTDPSRCSGAFEVVGL